MFSATSAMTAGRNIGSTATVNVGVWNSGSPTHGAAVIAGRVDVAEDQRQHVAQRRRPGRSPAGR